MNVKCFIQHGHKISITQHRHITTYKAEHEMHCTALPNNA